MLQIPFVDLPPLTAASGRVRLPGSKSISNRVLLLAGLSTGTTVVRDLLQSDDTRVMLDALSLLGCSLQFVGDSLTIEGLGGRLGVSQADLFLGNAGTAMRPLTAALAVLAATQGGCFTLGGIPRMHERPIGDLVAALRQLGCQVEELGRPGYPPLRVRGESGGTLHTQAPVRVRGDVSSQFLTALLLALPLVSADTPVVVEVEGELISKPYVEITLNLLERFGIRVQRSGFERFTIPQGSRYRSPGEIHVEGDASSASYFVALAAIAAPPQAPIRIDGVGSASIQGDIRFVDAAEAMGARVARGPNWLEVHRERWPLQPIELDCTQIPDAAMTLAVMALYCGPAASPTRLTGIASWRVKETDRIAAMATELRRLGAEVDAGDDFIAVRAPRLWHAASIRTYDDHRMAMALALAAFNPLASPPGQVGVRIEDPACTGKTFPDYFEALFDLVSTDSDAVPVIAIDGPSASGKGTLAAAVAARLGYRLLDSGSLYRAAALAVLEDRIDPHDVAGVARAAGCLELRFDSGRIWFRGSDVTEDLRREDVGAMASRVASLPAVREALHEFQLDFRRPPGLVADGRDMGTVVFPGAALKVFLTASAERRAQRRLKQLIEKGIPATLAALREELEARDLRDRSRSASPLKPARDALELDNSEMSIDESVDLVLRWWEERRPFGK